VCVAEQSRHGRRAETGGRSGSTRASGSPGDHGTHQLHRSEHHARTPPIRQPPAAPDRHRSHSSTQPNSISIPIEEQKDTNKVGIFFSSAGDPIPPPIRLSYRRRQTAARPWGPAWACSARPPTTPRSSPSTSSWRCSAPASSSATSSRRTAG
jgi:hypothetical protein